MFGWPLLRTVLRRLMHVLVGWGLREVVRHGRQAAGTQREADSGEAPTIIDVERVDRDRPFGRFSEPARRVVARAAEHHGGGGVTGEALLLAVIESDPGAAEQLGRSGTDLDALRSHLRQAVAASGNRSGLTPGARRALRRAPMQADRRADRAVQTRDLLAALLAEDGEVAEVVDRYTAGALPRDARTDTRDDR